MAIIIIPIAVLLLIVTERILYRKYWDAGLDARLQFADRPAVEGEKSTLTEVITNGKALPVPILEVSFALDRGLRIENSGNQTVTDQTNATDVFSVHGHEKITRTLQLDCLHRGFYVINRTSLVAHDFLTSGTGYRNLEQQTHLYVYPGDFPAERLELPLEKIMGEISTRRFLYEDIFLRRGVRDYVDTDPQSRVNWKATARTGNLKVNLFDHSAGQSVRILLNLDDPTIWYSEEVLECSIRLAASLSRELIAGQIPVSLVTNGTGSGKSSETGSGEGSIPAGMSLGEGASAGHLRQINELLARIDLSRKRSPFAEFLREEITREAEGAGHAGETAVLISSSRHTDVAETAGNLAAARGGLLWLAPLTKDMKEEPLPGNLTFVRIDIS